MGIFIILYILGNNFDCWFLYDFTDCIGIFLLVIVYFDIHMVCSEVYTSYWKVSVRNTKLNNCIIILLYISTEVLKVTYIYFSSITRPVELTCRLFVIDMTIWAYVIFLYIYIYQWNLQSPSPLIDRVVGLIVWRDNGCDGTSYNIIMVYRLWSEKEWERIEGLYRCCRYCIDTVPVTIQNWLFPPPSDK